jgi:hypothetical protein
MIAETFLIFWLVDRGSSGGACEAPEPPMAMQTAPCLTQPVHGLFYGLFDGE